MDKKRKIIAALADLKQEIAGPIPVEIVSEWTKGQKTPHQQKLILQPFERNGYLVSADSSGLSRLTAERSLLEVMKIVSEPKEIIYHLGREIGGKGVGVWAADNAEMFYSSETVSAHRLLDAMAEAQKMIHRGPLQVGMAMHRGNFWEIGDGMFGEDADLLEAVAEDFTESKEIVVSETVKADLDAEKHVYLSRREDLGQFKTDFFSVDYDEFGRDFHKFVPSLIEHMIAPEHFYPFPFDRAFYLALKQWGQAAVHEQTLQSYYSAKAVLLIKVYHKKMRLLLDQLTDWVVVNALLNEIAVKYDVTTVKSNGDLAIFVADTDSEALALAEDVLESMRNSEDRVSIGIARGDVLLFNLESGGKDIAGGPVNVASKISEDIPDQDSLYVESSVKVPLHHLSRYEPFTLEKSGIVLKGLRYLNF